MIFDFLRKKKPKPEEQPEEKPAEQPGETSGEDEAREGETPPAAPDSPAEPVREEPAAEAAPAPEVTEPPSPEPTPAPEVAPAPDEAQAPSGPKEEKVGFFARIRRGLSRTSNQFAEGMGNLFLGAKEIDDELLEELETQLLMADVGMDATTEIVDRLTARVSRRELNDGEALYRALQEELAGLLDSVEAPLAIDTAKQPFVILVVGVNGVGKTTTIGKLAHRYLGEGKSVMLAAGDTFRAAAVEQLQVWGERHGVPVVAQHTGADSASVIYDAVQSAQSRGVDVVIADTAGRLHTKSNLMEELSKVRRVMGKLDQSAPHEVLLVLDAGTGQNALSQAEQFRNSAGVTGMVLTKLDGTAKGGVIFALAQRFGIPVRFIGVGEQAEDLQPFRAKDFVAALFRRDET
ncbi:signal recognition particle-docking protein FtsY [Microbulbifer sp. YPW16]|uniref:signal recognition particle-docking protein FtsY n=1 Tax=Microbulbifer sp. YPW16 TaxID=2904242 RepID=UPI001E3CD4B1|nr:signal recognition particle-docking protein FtsY [Microbulbifer sp. YPW16]UHQ53890.1 signal recognition particle-docking protein FtsY [Microbulbifer sp. YPW16]